MSQEDLDSDRPIEPMMGSVASGESREARVSEPAAGPTGFASKTTERRITWPAVAGWVTYDLANTIFSMGVISIYFPLWLRENMGREEADTYNGVITSISMAVIFFASPLLGAMTDRARRRMPFLVISTLMCVLATGFMATVGFYPTVLLFVVGNIAYQAGLQFYDAMLPEVSTEANRGKIGGLGVGIGYLGSYLAVGLGLVLSYVFGGTNKALYFSLVALLFLLFSLPCFLLVRERGNPYPRPLNFKMVRESTRETLITLRSSRRYPGLLRFLIGRMFYTDSINTVIGFMTLFAANVALHCDPQLDKGLAEDKATWIMVPAITFAILGGFSGGWLADRMGPKRMLHWVLRLWVCVFILASLISLLGLPLWTMYGVAVLAGIALGGTWAADRPYMLRLTPPNRVGEFYGLYGMVGRFSAIIGPALWAGIFVLATKKFGLTELRAQGLCILSLLLMILLSQFILRPVSDEPRNWAELEKQ